MQAVKYRFSKEKDETLKRERGIGFEEIITLIETGYVLSTKAHPNRERYPGQFIYEIDVNGYVCVVPFMTREDEVFLKTIYLSRKATRKYAKGEENDD